MNERAIQAILLHRCESGRTGSDVARAESATGCGYHYFIREDGTLDQLYPDTALVWHALGWSRSTIGVAIYGDFDPSEHSRNLRPTPGQINTTIDLCVSLWRKHGVLPIFGHTELPSATRYPNKRCPGANVDLRQIERETWLRWRKEGGALA